PQFTQQKPQTHPDLSPHAPPPHRAVGRADRGAVDNRARPIRPPVTLPFRGPRTRGVRFRHARWVGVRRARWAWWARHGCWARWAQWALGPELAWDGGDQGGAGAERYRVGQERQPGGHGEGGAAEGWAGELLADGEGGDQLAVGPAQAAWVAAGDGDHHGLGG